VAATLLVQALPALASRSLSQVGCVKPEPLLLALTAALVAVTMHALASERGPGVGRGVLMGAIVGIATCTKITAAPLALLPLLLLRRTSARIAFAAAALTAFAASIAPALEQLRVFGRFVTRIATHSGQYGMGAAGIFDPARYAAGLAQSAARNPDLVGVIVGGAALWILARRRAELRSDRWVRALGGALAAQVATVLLVARHPGMHYVLPATALSGLTVAIALRIAPRAIERRRLALVLAFPLAAFLSIREVSMGLARYRGFELARSEQMAAAAAARALPGATLVYYYRASAPVFALRFGDEYSSGRWTAWLSAHHPGAAFYDPFGDRFSSYGADGIAVPATGRPIVFQGSTIGSEGFTRALADHGLKPIFSGRNESVYLAPAIW
jgi:hypothetical protein